MKQKDPKKVAAGKARAAKAIRIDGKFTSNAFRNEVKRGAEMSAANKGKTLPKSFDLQSFLDEHLPQYEKLFHGSGLESLDLSDSKIIDTIQETNNTVYIRETIDGETTDRRVSKEQAIYEVLKLEQILAVNLDTAGFSLRLTQMFDGRMILRMPTADEIEEFSNMEEEDLHEALEEFGITVYAVYNGMSVPRKKEEKEKFVKHERIRENKLQKINKKLREAKANLPKNRAKRKKRK